MSQGPYAQQPQAQYMQQPGIQQVTVIQTMAPQTYMGWSIFNCLCCCWPIGIAAILYSNKVSERTAINDQAGAVDASQTARKLNIAATVLGVISIITGIIIVIIYVTVVVKATLTSAGFTSDIFKDNNVDFSY